MVSCVDSKLHSSLVGLLLIHVVLHMLSSLGSTGFWPKNCWATSKQPLFCCPRSCAILGNRHFCCCNMQIHWRCHPHSRHHSYLPKLCHPAQHHGLIQRQRFAPLARSFMTKYLLGGISDQQHVCPLQALLLEALLQATTITQAQVPPLALPQQATLAVALATAVALAMAVATPAVALAMAAALTPLAQKAPQLPRPRATSQVQPRIKPPRVAAAAMVARPMSLGTTAAAVPLPQGYQAQPGLQVQLALDSALAGLMPLAMSKHRSKATQFTMPMVLRSAGMAAMVATPALPWAGPALPLALVLATLVMAVAPPPASAVAPLAAAQALAVA